MRRGKLLPHMTLTALLLIIALILNAKTNSVISGKIINQQTNKPVIGASVILVGTNKGAQTDFEGKFKIINVIPGKYTLRITHLDYNAFEIKDIVIDSNMTKEFNQITLPEKTDDLETIHKVTADRDVVDKIEVSNQVNLKQSQVQLYINKTPNLTASKVKNNKRGYAFETQVSFPPVHGGSSIVNGEAYDAMFFKNYGVNPFVDVEDDSLSTFAIDVDDASYVMTRSYLNRGSLPPNEAVRTEEFVNHFNYNYLAPKNKTFKFFVETAPSLFGQNSYLLKVGIKGKEVRPENRKPANLVFVIDVSGSMSREDRLGLVKKSLRLLLDELNQNDKIGIVVYGSRGQVILDMTSIESKYELIAAIESLHSEGATNAEEGLLLGYEMANRHFDPKKINRIILCSDGVANVGRTGADDILKSIKEYAKKGITLTSVGFGMGNYNDILLEKLGNKGNGFYAYVDNLNEAKKIFVDNLTGTLEVIARDVKIQIAFDPRVVRSYRLLGYENRDVADNKFRDDDEDGGEIGAGHEVTALYEIKLTHNKINAPMGTLFVRYKDPSFGEVTEISREISNKVTYSEFNEASADFKLAACAAEFAEILRESYWAKGSSLQDVKDEVKKMLDDNDSNETIELLSLITKASEYKSQRAER